MQIEVGAILEGKVTSITKFGAFVELPENKTGMVHISEVSTGFVKEITDYLQENQIVKVKVIEIDKTAASTSPSSGCSTSRSSLPAVLLRAGGMWAGSPSRWFSPVTFEEMMSKFKADSDDKMSSLRRNVESKRGSGGRRRG